MAERRTNGRGRRYDSIVDTVGDTPVIRVNNIAPEGVIAHSDMAPGRKSDPGPRFDWTRLARNGLAAPTRQDAPPSQPDPDLFRSLARNAGYTADVDEATLLGAVRLRHRPHARGPLSTDDFRPLGCSCKRT